MKEILSILVVEENADAIFFLTSKLNTLRTLDIEPKLTITTNLTQTKEILGVHKFSVIIANLNLPDSQDLNTFLEIQKIAQTTPIILFGGSAEDENVKNAIKLGAQDYLPASDLSTPLLSRIITHAIERQRLHDNLIALSFTDELTGIYNRRGFFTLIEQQMSLTRRIKNGFYLFIIDFDYLKHINDTYGHRACDRALINTADCLRSCFRHHDIVGRVGGDEFAVAALNVGVEIGETLKTQLLEKLKDYNTKLNEPYHLAFSVGSAYYDGVHPVTLDELVQQADKELYHQKRLTH